MSLLSSLFYRKYKHGRHGFGLIELLVSISIMAIIMGIVLTRQDTFNGAVLLRSQAYEVALALREVQLNAVSASSIEGNYRTLLGVEFTTTNTGKNKYQIFRDINANGQIDSGEPFGKQGSLDKRFEISAIRVDGVAIPTVRIIFERPDFDAKFFNASGAALNASEVELDVFRTGQTGTGPGVLRTIQVTSTGQITVL